MINLKGDYNSAILFSDVREENAIEQVEELLSLGVYSKNKIRIMPDYHWGAGCTIGTTMNILDAVTPNLVGVDIGCGMTVVELDLNDGEINFEELDNVIRRNIPSGFNVRQNEHWMSEEIDMNMLRSVSHMNMKRVSKAIGSLGGGNHFIELGTDGKSYYLVVHSGSRNIGKQVADYYQKLAIQKENERIGTRKNTHIEQLKMEGRHDEIQEFIEGFDANNQQIPNALCPVRGDDLDDYLHDMDLCQKYADMNRRAMVNEILSGTGWNKKFVSLFSTIHNFIDVDEMMLRKGAVSAKAGERLIIPINMRDGSIIAVGKGNDDWNQSAPHGAGRVLGRNQAKNLLKNGNITMDDFKAQMVDVFTTSVKESTIDESPFAYKGIDYILRNIGDTVDVEAIVKPVYNFKAS